MASPSTGIRPGIEAQLNELAEKHIAAFDSYTQVVNDPATGHTAAYTVEEGLRLTVAKYRAFGLTLEKIKAFYGNYCENTGKLNELNTMSNIGEDEGHNVFHILSKPPFPLSKRSTIAVQYMRNDDESFNAMISSKGTEALVKENAKLIGKNVLARTIINFERYIPFEGGYDIVTVVCTDPAGSIPDFLKKKKADKDASYPLTIANFMLTGAVCPI